MCGIAGILSPAGFSSGVEPLEKMSSALVHRGPDAAGIWHDESGKISLAHRRLSIIDLSVNASQPLHYLDRYVVIHNGEIYNYIELRNELIRAGYQFRSASDTEVIAASFDAWKESCLNHFDGMFSFAIWDKKEQRLFAARDRLGEKPFFFHYDGVRLIFASEMKALWEAGVSRQPNLYLLFNFITIGYTGNPENPRETFYTSVEKLPPAHYLTCVAGTAPEIVCYWSVEIDSVQSISEDDALDQFTGLMKTSIRRRLRSDVPIGSSLSGGIDSSAVLALATSEQNFPPGNFIAFTAVFPGFQKDESAYAELVTRSKNIRHKKVSVDATDFPVEWERLMHFQEEPVGSASAYPQYKVFELARQEGVKVLLDGQGADEILAGYTRYYKWYWQELFRRARLLRSGELRAARANGVTEKFGLRNMIAALFPDMASVVLEKRYLLQALRHEDLEKDFAKQYGRAAYYATPPYFSLNGALHFNTFTYGLEELLRYADRNSMAHGREVRLPFLSHELVEFVFSLPASMKIRKGRTKWLLREAMKNELPAEVVWRTDKIGFEPPQKKWMCEPTVQAMIKNAKQKLADAGILNKTALTRPVTPRDAHDANNYDWRYLSAAHLIK